MHTLELTDAEIEFLRQLFESELAVSIRHVETLAGLKAKVKASAPAQSSAMPQK